MLWSQPSGALLREQLIEQFKSNMIVLSLLLGTELAILFNPDSIGVAIRAGLQEENICQLPYWIGLVIILSVVLTMLSLFSTLTCWTMIASISDANAHCILRSSIGQFVTELPSRLITSSIYTFIVWLTMLFFVLLPVGITSCILVSTSVASLLYIVMSFSCFGRIILHTSAMGSKPIFDVEFEKSLLPRTLHANLLKKAKAELANNTSITRQYRRKAKPIHREFRDFRDLSNHLRTGSDKIYGGGVDTADSSPTRARADSTVHFAEKLWSVAPTPSSVSDTSVRTTGTTTPANQTTGLDQSEKHQSPTEYTEKAKKEKEPPARLATQMSQSGSDSSRGVDGSQQTAFGIRAPSIQSVEEWLHASSTVSADQDAIEASQRHLLQSQSSSVGQTEWSQRTRPPFQSITTNLREASVASSLRSTAVDKLSEDERFERDYGDLFDPESGSQTLSSEFEKDKEEVEDGTEQKGQPGGYGSFDEETNRLLPAGNEGTLSYDSFPERDRSIHTYRSFSEGTVSSDVTLPTPKPPTPIASTKRFRPQM